MRPRAASNARAAIALAFFAAVAGYAQSPMGYLPKDTLVFLSAPDMDRTAASFEHTALHEIWGDPEVQPALRKAGEWVLAAARAEVAAFRGKTKPQGGLSKDDFSGVFGGQATLALLDLDASFKPPVPRLALVLGVRDERRFAALCAKLDAAMASSGAAKLHKEAPQIRGAAVTVWTDGSPHAICRARVGGLCVLTISTGAMDTILAGLAGAGGATVAAAPSIAQVQRRLGGSGCDLIVHVNVARLLPHLGLAGDAAAATGLADVRSATLGLRIAPPGVKDALYIHAPGQRRGLLGVVQPGDAPAAMLALAPPNARCVRVAKLDLLHAATQLSAALKATLPYRHAVLSARVKRFEQTFGLDVRREVLAALGDRFATVTFDTRGPSWLGLGAWAAIGQVRDAALLRRSLDRMTSLSNAAAKSKSRPRPWRTMKHAGAVIHYAVGSVPLLSPAFAVTDRYAAFALHPQAIKLALDRMGKPSPDVRSRPDFQQAVSRVSRPCTMLRYTDLRAATTEAYAALPAFLTWLAGRGRRVQIDPALLPPLDKIASRLFGSGASLTCDAQGLCWECYSPYGGVTLGCAAAGWGAWQLLKP